MNISINYLKTDKIIMWSTLVALLLLCVATAYSFVSYTKLPPFLPLFNQMPWGDARLATKENIFILPLIAFIALLGNLFLSSILYTKIPLIARILCITTLLTSVFVFLLTARTIQLVL